MSKKYLSINCWARCCDSKAGKQLPKDYHSLASGSIRSFNPRLLSTYQLPTSAFNHRASQLYHLLAVLCGPKHFRRLLSIPRSSTTESEVFWLIACKLAPAMATKHLTCRQWKLSPISCLKDPAECMYSHYDTGVMSGPVNITCWAWQNGGCKLHEEGCLFSHHQTDMVQNAPCTTRRKS